jgi:dCTP deaminase
MILTGTEIIREFSRKRIMIDPFDCAKATTNSYDLTLGHDFIRYREGVLDPRKANKYDSFKVSSEGIQLSQGDFVLGHSVETIGSNYYVALIHAKSGVARLGLFVHITADIIDIGSHGHITFQLHSTLPIRLYPGMTIAQVSFWKPQGKIILYDGKYQGSRGPRASEVHKEFFAPRSLDDARSKKRSKKTSKPRSPHRSG